MGELERALADISEIRSQIARGTEFRGYGAATLAATGVFASCRFLPRPMLLVGGWYLATALACLARARGADTLSPWAMGVPFAVGQLMVAAILQLAARRP